MDATSRSQDEELKKVRLAVVRLPGFASEEDWDFSQGGLFVPTAEGGAFTAQAREASAGLAGAPGSRHRALAEAYLPQKSDTPVELARNLAICWRRAIKATASGPALCTRQFVLTAGAPSLARTTRALAMLCRDVRRTGSLEGAGELDRFAAELVVLPRLWERSTASLERPDLPIRGGPRRFVALCMVTAPRSAAVRDG